MPTTSPKFASTDEIRIAQGARKLMKTFDSTLAYYISQLNNLDPKLYMPLVTTSWGRDIKLRSGISMSDEATSFIRASFGGVGTQSATGKPWLSPNSTTIPGVSIDGELVSLPLRLLEREVSYSSVELDRSQRNGNPIDRQKFDALNKLYQLSTDEMVYVGDTAVGAKGLINSTLVTSATVANGASASPLWSTKTADEILTDVNTLLQSTWTASGYDRAPDKLLLPPVQFARLVSTKVSSAGNVSTVAFLEENSLSLRINGRKLDIQPLKWLTGAGAGGTDRMLAYTNDEELVRFPMVPIRREAPYVLGIRFNSPYLWAYGEVEFVYPETVRYADGI
jgi:hypothetical protein